jgi:hypothetical protein
LHYESKEFSVIELDSAQKEEQISTEAKVTAPKNGERINCDQHEGLFEVVFVNALMQTANIRLADGTAHVIPNVPWTSLKAVGKK